MDLQCRERNRERPPGVAAGSWQRCRRARFCRLERSRGLFRWRLRCRAWRGAALGLLLLAGAAARGDCAFDEPLLGPREAALAGAAPAGSGDSTALFWNPAAAARDRGGDCAFAYSRLHAGLPGAAAMGEGLLSAAVATPLGTLALGAGGFQAQGLMSEHVLALGVSRRVLGAARAGVAVKLLRRGFFPDARAGEDPVFSGGAAAAAAAWDAGLAARSGPWGWGAALRNVNAPDLGLGSEDRVARQAQAGVSREFASLGLRAFLGASFRDAAGGAARRLEPAAGLEKSVAGGRAAFRAGVSSSRLAAGFGVRAGRVGVDYAVVMSPEFMADNAGTHVVGVSFRFGAGEDSSP